MVCFGEFFLMHLRRMCILLLCVVCSINVNYIQVGVLALPMEETRSLDFKDTLKMGFKDETPQLCKFSPSKCPHTQPPTPPDAFQVRSPESSFLKLLEKLPDLLQSPAYKSSWN